LQALTVDKLKVKKLKNKKIAITSDHAGFHLKEKLLAYLIREKYDVKDLGAYSAESVDYPDFGHPLANGVSAGEYELGISICGTGNGINMVVNKHPGIRAALCWNEELSRLSRAHNDANILTLPGWFISESEAYLITKTFLTTDFEGGRHSRRVEKISLKMY
jgi:ribose 5-phosphate isomerase B